jgi:uncharacterized repeat protein (TIGR01451 family)
MMVGAGSVLASSPPATLPFDHGTAAQTRCASADSNHDLTTSPKMSQTGIAFDGRYLYISCWGDTTITAVNPHDGSRVAIHTITPAPGSHFNLQAFGALAWDRQDGTLWACGSTSSAGSGSPENQMSEVGIINLTLDTYTPVFNTPGCDNGLAWDPGTAPGRQDTLWTSADTATTIYNWTLGGTQREQHLIGGLMGVMPANSGIAIGGGTFYLANPKTTTKRVYSLNAALNGYADPTEPLISSKHRYEDMECDDVTYAPQTVIWVMWFNQNVLQPLPIQGTCGSAPPPPPELSVTQSSNSPTAGSDLVFTDTVQNAGPGTEHNVTLSQSMPSNVSFESANASTGSCTPGTPLTCSLGDLGPGYSVKVTVRFATYGPGSVASPVSASSDETPPVAAPGYSAMVQPAPGVTYVTVGDSGISPVSPAPPIGGQVRFVIQGSQAHEVADSSGLSLFDTGPLSPPAAYDTTYPAAGAYAVTEDPSGTPHTATVQIATGNPLNAKLADGPFTVAWAVSALPAGCVEDVQVLVPGGSWVNLVHGTTALSQSYTPSNTGTYKFRARLRCGTAGSAYSTGNSTQVS